MSRPKIKISLTPIDWVFELITLIGIILTIGFVSSFYNDLPDNIPSHFSLNGNPDSVGGKSVLIILSSIGIIIYLIFTIASRFPHVFNYPFEITTENADRQYKNAVRFMRTLKMLIVLIFFNIIFVSIQNGLGRMRGLETWFIPAMLLIVFITIAFFIYRAFKLR